MAGEDAREIQIPADGAVLEGVLTLPELPRGLILFAHGSGSSRHSPRNQAVARGLRAAGFGTLLMDLLTAREEAAESATRHLRFNIQLLAARLVAAIDWTPSRPGLGNLDVGLFGASTGAGAALVAAAQRQQRVSAVVSRGGRSDLAAEYLPQVQAPTLLIVGGHDAPVIDLNQAALAQLTCPKELVIVPGASHLFEEPGALTQVCRLAGEWFASHLNGREEP